MEFFMRLIWHLIIVMVSISIIACNDNTNNPIPIDTKDSLQKYFPLSKGNYWEYYNASNEKLEILIKSIDSSLWSGNFWDTVKKSKFKTYILKYKTYTGSIGNSTEYAFQMNNKSFVFGTKQHKMLKNYSDYPSEFFVELFRLPNNLSTQTNVRDTNMKLGNEIIEFKETLTITEISLNSKNSNKTFLINYMAESSNKLNQKYNLQFEITENIGFIRIDDYLLKYYTLED